MSEIIQSKAFLQVFSELEAIIEAANARFRSEPISEKPQLVSETFKTFRSFP